MPGRRATAGCLATPTAGQDDHHAHNGTFSPMGTGRTHSRGGAAQGGLVAGRRLLHYAARSRGDALHRLPGAFPQRTEMFAEAGQQIAQPLVEEVLREAVSRSGVVPPLPGLVATHPQQHDDGVLATIVNERGEQRQIRGVLRPGL